jgi:hypothetical protein
LNPFKWFEKHSMQLECWQSVRGKKDRKYS